MTAYRVFVTPIAETGIVETYYFIRSQSPIDAERWLIQLYNPIDMLSTILVRCPVAPESAYFHMAGIVRVLYVRHMAQRNVGVPLLSNDKFTKAV